MKRLSDLVSRLFPRIALSLALTGAGCGVAVENQGPVDGARPELPDIIPDLPDYELDEDGINRLRTIDGVLRLSTARGTADGGNASGVHSCLASQPGQDHYEHGGIINGTQLHVVSAYESLEGAQNGMPGEPTPEGPVEVKLNRPGKSVLVLSGIASVTWNVIVGEGVTLEGIIASGEYPQAVNAPAGVPVWTYSREEDGESLGEITFEAPIAWPSFATTDLVDAAELLTGLELTSFRGCYTAESFQIDEPGELRPPHPELPPTEPRIIAGCEALTAESNYCMIENGYAGSSYTMVGLDSGTTCGQISVSNDNQDSTEASLAWAGDYLYTCNGRGLARISIVDGSVDIAPMYCAGVTTRDGGLLALVGYLGAGYDNTGMYLVRFASFADATRRDFDWAYQMAPTGTRITAHGDDVYIAWHATNLVQTAEISNGAEFQDIPLEDYDDWIFGMDVTSDGKLVLVNGSEQGIHIFDVNTGEFLGQPPYSFSWPPDDVLPPWLGGIDCVSGGAVE